MSNLLLEHDGKITLPDALRDRYHLTPETPIRVVETQSGILLVPITQEPMSAALAAEIAEWQALGAESLELFAYEDEAE